MRITVAKLVGLPGGGAWSQIHAFLPAEEEKQSSHGELIAAITLGNISGAVTAIELGREVLSRLHEEYFGKGSGSVLERLSKAVSRVVSEFGPLQPELVTLVIWRSYAYFCITGRGQVLLWRQRRLSRLFKGTGQEPISLSGEAKVGDIFLLATEGFSLVVTGELLLRVFGKNLSSQELADELAPFVHKAASSTVAAAIIEIGEVDLPAQAGSEKGGGETTVLVAEEEAKASSLPRVMGAIGVMEEIRGLFKKWLTGIASWLPERSFYAKRDYVNRDKDSSRRTAISVGIILIILLLISIFFGLRQKGVRQYKATYSDRLVQAQSSYEESLLQKDVDKLLAKESFRRAEGIVGELTSEGIKDEKLDQLKQNIEKDRAVVLGIIETKPTVFLDLGLVRSGVSAQEIALHQGVMAILDKGGGRIMSVAIDSKETKVVAGTEKTGNAVSAAFYSGRYFSVSEKGVLEFDKQGVSKVAVQPDSETGEVWRIAAFGGNIYLFAKNGEIWRYPVVESGFGTKQRWLGKGVAPETAQGVDVAIDGSIWILSGSGKIAKFTRGTPEAFQIKGLDAGFSDPRALYTDEDLTSIFVLDNSNSQIAEIGKNDEYLKQYRFGEIGDIGETRDIVVSKKAGKIFLLTETKILEISLK